MDGSWMTSYSHNPNWYPLLYHINLLYTICMDKNVDIYYIVYLLYRLEQYLLTFFSIFYLIICHTWGEFKINQITYLIKLFVISYLPKHVWCEKINGFLIVNTFLIWIELNLIISWKSKQVSPLNTGRSRLPRFCPLFRGLSL